MNPSLRQLAVTLLWSETDKSDEMGGQPFDVSYSPEDIDADSLQKLSARFQSFVAEAERLIAQKVGNDWSSIDDFYTGSASGPYQTEHDFIMTVNSHGCGFWETSDWPEDIGEILTTLAQKHAEIHADLGDDGKVYLTFC